MHDSDGSQCYGELRHSLQVLLKYFETKKNITNVQIEC